MFFLGEELHELQEPGSYVGEVVKAMSQTKILVKVNPEGKYVVDLGKGIDVGKCLVGIEHGGLMSTTDLTQ